MRARWVVGCAVVAGVLAAVPSPASRAASVEHAPVVTRIDVATQTASVASRPVLADLTSSHDHDSIHVWLDCQTCHYVDDGSARTPEERRLLLSGSCEDCHQNEAVEQHASWHQAQLDVGNLSAPVCADCHEAHPPTTPAGRVETTRMCTSCHTDEGRIMAGSVHSVFDPLSSTPAGQPAPTCTDCHGSHTATAAVGEESQLCGTCHTGVVDEYHASVHGVGFAHGDADVATCSDCHGEIHDIQPVEAVGSSVSPLNLPRTCGRCHGDSELARRHGLSDENVYQLFMDSVHGRALTQDGLLVSASCDTCHGSHDIKAPGDSASSVNRENVPDTCGQCHAGIQDQYRHGAHGQELAKGNPDAPVCTDCHSTHDIGNVDGPETSLGIVGECGDCHEESLDTFRDTLHGQVTSLGFTAAAECSDCHEAHDVLPADDPASSVNQANLVQTCGQCHPDANANFVKYNPHADDQNAAEFPLEYWARLFMQVLIFGVFVFFGTHTVLWLIRSLRAKRLRDPAAEEAH